MVKRTFGWIQNPGDLKKLKKVVSIFQPGSAVNLWLIQSRLPLLLRYALISHDNYDRFVLELSKPFIDIAYSLLKGKGAGSSGRKEAICTGIIQAVIDAQQSKTYTDGEGNSIMIKKPYTDDWSAEGYLRWGISCGLMEYVKDTDSCRITELGMQLANSRDDSAEEREAFMRALLSYPPVIRILSLLEKKDNQTKFELGSQLGFKGEMGFTSIPQEIYICDYCEAETPARKSLVRSNDEGDSDKYARGIASWCTQMGWVESSRKFEAMRLGDSKRPDVIISYDRNGTIIDNKSYKDGFNINRTCADEMSRYINENIKRSAILNPNKWWESFNPGVSAYTFLFVTSYLRGEFEKQLNYISAANSGIKGAAISIENLLYFAEGIKSGKYIPFDFYNNFHNKEMIYCV